MNQTCLECGWTTSDSPYSTPNHKPECRRAEKPNMFLGFLDSMGRSIEMLEKWRRINAKPATPRDAFFRVLNMAHLERAEQRTGDETL